MHTRSKVFHSLENYRDFIEDCLTEHYKTSADLHRAAGIDDPAFPIKIKENIDILKESLDQINEALDLCH